MYTVDEIARIGGGLLLRGARLAPRRVVHDSRSIREGDLFVALRGQCADGHSFLPEAFARGACGALISDPSAAPIDAPNLIVVNDPLEALQDLAAAWRRTLDATFVGVTGSNGKTTTRALLATLLRRSAEDCAIFSAPENYNTEVGLPLAVLAMPEEAAIGLFELGAERPGDIALLADILIPQVGIITSVGPSHLGQFGSVECVAEEKWTLIEKLPQDSTAFINADSSELRHLADKTPRHCVSVGIDYGTIRGHIEQDVPQLVVRVDSPPLQLVCPLLGLHNAPNLLLAAAVAHHLNVSPVEIEQRVGSFAPEPHRLQPIAASFGTILDDTYNANPASMAGAIRTLAQLGPPQTLSIFVFGEMRDLGPDGDRAHREILDLALELGIDAILPIGEQAVAACRLRRSEAILIVHPDDVASTARRLCLQASKGNVLIKGSRVLGLERVVDELTE